jgi:hypothetical protein
MSEYIDYISESAQGVDALLPVQIDQSSDSYKEYSNTFYPASLKRQRFIEADEVDVTGKSKRKRVERLTSKEHFFELIKYLAEVSAYYNSAFSMLRGLVVESQYNSEPQPDRDFSRAFRLLLARHDTDNAIVAAAKNFMDVAGSGRLHIIRPSVKMPGGFDIIYSGIPGKDPGTSSCLSVTTNLSTNELPPRKDSYTYENLKEVYNNQYGIMGLSKGKEIQQALLGKSTPIGDNMSAHMRHSAMLPVDFDFKTVLDRNLNDSIIKKVLGVDTLADLSNFPKIPEHLIRSLGKYFSILVSIEPNNIQVNWKSNRSEEETVLPEKQPVSNEYLTLQPDLTFSIVAHIPKDIAEFITQTPSNEKIPLTSLNTWASIWSRAVLRVPKAKAQGGRIPIKSIPRYIIAASATQKLNEGRKKLGFYTENGRSNDDDIYVSNTGRLNYCPKASEIALDNAINLERILEEALTVSYEAGSPLNSNQIGETHKCFSLVHPEYKEKIAGLKQKISKYAGSLQSYSWDYNCILTSAISDPDKLVPINLSGSTRPDDLSLADYLKKPFAESMRILFDSSIDGVTKKQVTTDTFGGSGQASPMLNTTLFKNIYNLYEYLLLKKLVPTLQDLVTSSAKEMGYNSLALPPNDEGESPLNYEQGLYTPIILQSLQLTPAYVVDGINKYSAKKTTTGLNALLEVVLRDSYGAPRSNVARIAARQGIDVVNDPHYFSPSHFTLAEFKNIYNYLGGRVFLTALKAIQAVSKKDLMLVNTDIDMDQMPSYTSIVKEVMPFVYILGKYAIDSEKIYERAEILVEANTRDTSIGAADIHIPGSPESFQMFPHQVEANQSLRGKVPPRYAVLDVAPGGGKTALLLSDIACLIHGSHIKRPIVLAPNGLVKNWVEDMQKVTGNTWNMIPVTTLSYRTWGDDRLTKMIQNAPRNTVVVVGFSVAKLDKYPVVLGNHVEHVSGTLEFLKKFGFDYVAIDESHKLKNERSAIHKAVKQLTVSSVCKYIRLATGTLISNKLTDVVGQAAIFSSQIFRTANEYEEENSERVGDSKAMVWKQNTPQLAREQLARHCAVVTFKRKEWAFMLPRPLETFIPVRLEKSESEGGLAHQLMYDAILKETLEEIKSDPNIKKLLSGKDEDTDDDDADSDDDDNGTNEIGLPDDLDDATLAELEAQLNPYLQRLEQLLTDPLGDPFGEIYFKEIDPDSFISNKVLKIIERIRLNFQDFPWVKGSTYNLKSVIDHEGTRYVLMGKQGEKLNLESYKEEYISTITPDKDPRWKEESRGKVIVFCRYTRTVNAIYKSLPSDLKKLAVKFHGEEKNKWANLNSFKEQPISKDKGVQILIANEQAITEGHNLQMANRLIRVEQPWAPGDLDQAAARIFRPDPSGKFKRENIFLDWVLTNGTIEVAKMGRLISKMLSKTQFDEAHNELYDELKEWQLPLIKMSLKTIADTPSLGDIREYVDAYKMMVHIQSAEFEEMRQTKPSKMIAIEQTAMFPDSAIIEHVPYIPNLQVIDRHDYGLDNLNSYLEDNENPDVKELNEDKKKLIGRFVHTEFGNGVIVNVGLTGKDGRDPGKQRKITRIDVHLATGDMYDCDPSLVYLATNLDANSVKNFTPKVPWVRPGDKKKAERLAIKVQRQKAKEEKRQKKLKEKLLLSKLKDKYKLTKTKGKKRPAEEVEATNNVELYQVIYNGFLALEAIPNSDDESFLEDSGYAKFGDYAYIKIPNAKVFDAVLDQLESKFEFSPDTEKRLNSVADTFHDKGKQHFRAELAPLKEFKNFYLLRHKISTLDKSTRKPIIKVYPVVMNGELMLNVDIATNPAIKKLLNKNIPGATVKWDDAHSIWIKFFSSKGDLVRHVKQIKADGVTIDNYEDMVEEVRGTNFKTGMR